MSSRWSRRRFAAASGVGLCTTALVGHDRLSRAAQETPPRNLVLVVASGGWDTTVALDAKPGLETVDTPEGEFVELGGLPIFAHASRPNVTAFFEAYGERAALINGLQTQSIVHADCAKRVLTGTASDANPDLGAIVAFEHGRELPAPYLVLGQLSYTGPLASISARAGTANQLSSLIDPRIGFPSTYYDYPGFGPTAAEDELIRNYVLARAEAERAARGRSAHNQARIADFVASLERGDRLAAIADFGEFEYTRDLGIQAGIAVDALDQGLSWAVQVELGEWDTHEDNRQQTTQHETFYAGLTQLLDELAARPGKRSGSTLLDETVVAVLSEMGRTPKLNQTGGKDHWPTTSALVLGPGVAAGQVLGLTDDRLDGQSIDFATGQADPGGKQLQYSNFAAGLLQLCGVDPALYIPNVEPFHALCV